jgi:hypothetical protein
MKALSKIPVEMTKFSYVLVAVRVTVDLSQNLYVLKAHTRNCGHGKDKVRPTTGHEGPQGVERYSSSLSLTSALDGVHGQRHATAAFPPGKRRSSHLRWRLGGLQGRSGPVRKTLTHSYS